MTKFSVFQQLLRRPDHETRLLAGPMASDSLQENLSLYWLVEARLTMAAG